MNALHNIMNWYASQCNGDWEHNFGVKIDTLDNPGWAIEIDLNETNLANRVFDEVDIQRTDDDWIYCIVVDEKLKGAGGVGNLEELLSIFLRWAENYNKSNPSHLPNEPSHSKGS